MRAGVADQHALAGGGAVVEELLLDRLGGDVVARLGDQDVLHAADDLEVAFEVQFALIAGEEPAVLQGLGGGLGAVPVAGEDAGAADQELAVGVELELAAAEGEADVAGLDLVGLVHGDDRGGLGEAVDLVDAHADELEPPLGLLGEGGRAADQELEAGADLALDRGEDELAGGGEGEAVEEVGGALTVLAEGVLAAAVEGGRDAAALLDLGADAVADALEHGGDVEVVVRVGGGHLLHEVGEVGAEEDRVAAEQLRPQHDARAGEAQREEVEHAVGLAAAAGDGVHGGDGLRDHVVDVGAGEHGALGLAAGARGVDDRDGVVGGEGVRGGRDRGGLQGLAEEGDAAVLGPGVAEGGCEGVVAGEHEHGAAVAGHDRELVGVLAAVEGDDDGALGEGGEVGGDPQAAVGGEEGDAVAGLDAGAAQEAAEVGDVLEELGAGGGLLRLAVDLDHELAVGGGLRGREDGGEEVHP